MVSFMLSFMLPSPSHAQTVIIPLDPAFTDDSYINRDDSFDSRGTGSNVRVGFESGELKRGVLRFDTALVPNADSVISVILVASIKQNNLDGFPMTLEAYSLGEHFIEGTGIDGFDVSWVHRLNGIPWTTPGGTYDPGAVSSTTIDWWEDSLAIDVTGQFQAWVADTSQNHGLVLGDSVYFAQPTWNYGDHNIRLYSTDDLDPAEHPYLIVTYGTPVIIPAPVDSICVVLDSASTRDSYIESANSHSHGDRVYVRMGDSIGDTNRGVLQFNLNKIAKLDSIAQATLIWPLSGNTLVVPEVYESYPLVEHFKEGQDIDGFDVCWPVRQFGIPWTRPGGTYDSTIVSVATVNPGDTELRIDITQAFQLWAADTTQNFGLVLGKATGFVTPGVGNGDYIDAWSTEEADTSKHPKILIHYDTLRITTTVVDSVVAEIEPHDLVTSTLDTLTLSIDLNFASDFTDEGVDEIYVDMPNGFTLDEVVAVRRWSFPYGNYTDQSTADALSLDFWFTLSFDGLIEIDVSVNTPAAPTLGGVWFNPRVGNTTSGNWQIVAEGEANGTPGDWDQLRVDVGTVNPFVTISPDTAYMTTDALFGFSATFWDSVTHNETWTHLGGLGNLDTTGVFDPHTVGNGYVIVNEGAIADTAYVIVDYGFWASMALSPIDTTIQVGGRADITLSVADSDSNWFTPDPTLVAWSEPGGLGSVDSVGEFSGTTPGTTHVWASYGGFTDSARVIVLPGSLDSIYVTPNPDTVTADSTRQFYAFGLDQYGNPVSITHTWHVIPASIGVVNGSGLFTPTRVGSGIVRAQVGPIKGDASVTVVPGAVKTVTIIPDSLNAFPGDTVSFAATAFDTIGTPLDTSLGNWSTLSGFGVSLGGGSIHAISSGLEQVVFEMDGQADTASLTIFTVVLDSIRVAPDSASITADSTCTFSATGYYSDASNGPIIPTWSAVGGVGSVNTGGVFTPSAIGSGYVLAVSGSHRDSSAIQVTPGVLDSIAIAPDSASVVPSDTVSFSYSGYDRFGTPLVTSSPTWSALDGNASSLGGGDYRGLFAGSERVVCTIGSISDTASLTVLPAVLDSITISPTSISISADTSQTFTATGHYSDASSSTVVASWSVLGGVGTIDGAAWFDAITAGSGAVVALFGGRSDTADVTVTVGALATVDVTPTSQTASEADTVSYLARGFDSDGNEILPMVGGSWWSNNGFATPLGGGAFSCDTAGVDTIAAQFLGIADSASLNITAAALDSIVIAPPFAVVATDSTIVFGATGYFDNAISSPVSATWTVVGGIGTILTDGTFDPTTPGAGMVIATRGMLADTADVTVTIGAVYTVTIVPDIDTIAVGDSIAFTATAMDADSNVFVPTFVWNEPTGLGSVDSTGLFISAALGWAEILVDADGVIDAAGITIVAGPLASIVISPAPDTLSSDTTLAFSVSGFDALGFPVPVNPFWSVIGSIGSIDGSGSFTGGTAGYGAVVADSGAIADTVWFHIVAGIPQTVTVAPDSAAMAAGDTVTFTALVRDGQGNSIDTTVAWSVSGLGTIDSGGDFTGTTTSTDGINATLGTISDDAIANVTAGVPVTFAIAPHDTTVTADETIPFTLTSADLFGNPVSLDSVTWSGGASIGTIDVTSGLFDAVTAGTGTVAATWTDTTITTGTITILPGTAASVTLLPASMLITVGSDSAFVLTMLDADGNVTTGSTTWSVAAGAVGTVDGTGLFSADSVGTGFVIATVGSIADSSVITVFDNAGLHVVAVLEDRASVIQGEDGIPVSVVIENLSGDTIEDLDATLHFTIAGVDVTDQYVVAEIVSKSHTIANGESDTLLFHVTVLGTATTDSIVTIDASAAGVLQTSSLPTADLASNSTGDWIVLSGLLLDDVARSFYPGKMRPGESAGFIIILRNEGAEDLVLLTGTRLVIDNGTTTVEASLLEAVDLPAGGDGSTARFETETIPSDWAPGSYSLAFLVDGENEAGVPLVTTYTAKRNALQIAPPYVLATAQGVDGAIHPPGTEGVILSRLDLVNLYETDRTLVSVSGQNTTTGSGSQADRDGILTAVHVIHDRDRDGAVGAADTTLGTGTFAGGVITFSDLALTLAPVDTLSLLTTADVSLWEAPDGSRIGIAFTGDTLSFDCGPGTIVFGADSLYSNGDHFVDGMIAEQIGTSAPFLPNVAGGAIDSLALVLDIPSNGYEPDTIRSLAIRNFGTAEVDIDISAVSIWRDGGNGVFDRTGGDDTRLGKAGWIGEGYWSLSELVPVPRGGIRLFATADITDFARESQTILLGVPVDGADMISRNDGPIDTEARLFSGRTIGSANRILFSHMSETGVRVAPPGSDVQLLRFTLSNLYSDSVSVNSITIVDDSDTEMDSAFSRITIARIHASEEDFDVAEVEIIGGTGALGGFTIALAPGQICTLSIDGTIATSCVSDGARLAIHIESATAFTTGLSRFVTGLFPAETQVPITVDGFGTAQITADILGDGPIAPGGTEQLLLRVRIPSNGCLADRFRAIAIRNAGSADFSAFSSLRLAAAGASVGALVWDGLAWVRDGFDIGVPSGGIELELYGSVAPGALEGETIRLQINVDGIDMSSNNDGPVDAPFPAPDQFTITDAPLFTRFATPRPRVSVGQTFDVTLLAINISPNASDTLFNVTPATLGILGPATEVDPPAGSAAILAPGDTTSFTWTIQANAVGTVAFSGHATATGLEGFESSVISTSPPITVQLKASGVIVNIVSAIPSSVTRGLNDLRAFVLDCSHQDEGESEYSDLLIHNLKFRITDEDGFTLPPDKILKRAFLQRTGITIGETTLAPNADSTVTVAIQDSVRIVPGGGTSLVLLFDLVDSSTVARFRVGFEQTNVILTHDANSHATVSIDGNVPYLSEVVGLFNAPSGLEVVATNLLPPAVNSGSADVPVGELTLSSSGIPEETASILVDNLCLVVTDTLFPYTSLSVWAGDVRHFVGSGWSSQGDTLFLPMIPALGIPANNPIRVTLRGDVGMNANLGPAAIDSAFVLTRSASQDSLPIVVTSHEAFGTTVTERIAGVPGRAQNRIPIDPVFQGTRSVPVIDVVFEPGPVEFGAAALVRAITLSVEDTTGADVPIAGFANLIVLKRDGIRLGAASPAGLSGNEVRIALDTPVPIRPGFAETISIELDLFANTPRGDYRLVVDVASIELEDQNDGSAVPFVAPGDEFKTSVLAVREVTSRVDLYFDASLPATAVGGGTVESGATLRLLASGDDGDVALHLSSFAITVEDDAGNTITPADLIASAVARTSNGNEIPLTLENDRLVALFDEGGETMTPGDTLTLSVDWTVIEDASIASYRVHILEDEVELVENVALLARAFDDPGTNPSGLTYFVDKSFDTSLRNYPNPFPVADGTTIAFYSHGGGRVSVDIFTGLGVPVKTITQTIDGPGLVEIFWQGRNGDGKNVISGVYLASIVVTYNDGKRDHAIHKIAVLN